MKSSECLGVVEQRELIIATACVGLAHDLKSIDPAVYHLFFSAAELPEVFEVINQTVDEHFPSHSMNFACTGECILSWNDTPLVALDFEFECDEVSAFFRLYFGEKGVAATLHHISFSDGGTAPTMNNRTLKRQLEAATRR